MADAENRVAVIGAGPAGFFATECLLKKGIPVSLYDQMPSPLCKFLVAGSHGGLNISNTVPLSSFASRYGENEERFSLYLNEFSPLDLQNWLSSMGIQTFTGSGGKIFPEGVSTSEIIERWMASLRSFPLFEFIPGHIFSGIKNKRTIVFKTANGSLEIEPNVAIFTLGGASWSRTGSDGLWKDIFSDHGLDIAEFESANCGYEINWSPFVKAKFINIPLKNICMTVEEKKIRGEILLTPYGIEGSLVYTFGSMIRKTLHMKGTCTVFLDLLPDWTIEKIHEHLDSCDGKYSLANSLRKMHLAGESLSLVRENATNTELHDNAFLSRLIKHFPLVLLKPRPLEEAISTAGGIRFNNLDENLMMKKNPGWFCAGEMLDWESPTGGFLLQGCFSTAFHAANGAAKWFRASK